MTRTTARRHPLRGWYVISLRPLNRHGGLRRAAAARGARVFALSTLALEALDAGAALEAALGSDVVIATSPAAVQFARPDRPLRARRGQAWYALGGATATALRRRGITQVATPEAGSDSEALLDMPGLRALRGRGVGLLTAPGGRGLIARSLRARGARIEVAETYRRLERPLRAARLTALAALPARRAVLLTSLEAFTPLWQALDASGRARLRACPCVVASDRLAAHARSLGFRQVLRARGPRPAQLLEALAEHAVVTGIR